MLTTALTALTAFSVTNVDDIVILTLLFSRLDRYFRVVHVVGGQFLGIATLVLLSLIGFVSRTALPHAWLGLLGLVPICLGLVQLVKLCSVDASEELSSVDGAGPLELASVLGVAGITVANGSDNLGVYIPMFATETADELLLTLAVFGLLTGLWCLLGWWLTRLPALAALLSRYGALVLPAVLIALGGAVLHRSHTLQSPGLAALTFAGLVVLTLSQGQQLQHLLAHRSLDERIQP